MGAEIYARFKERAFSHDPDDASQLVFLGHTSRGTRVSVNRRVHESKRIIATGTVVLHYFGGFGGGRKSILPGIASTEAIAHNHSLNLHPSEPRLNSDVAIGRLDGNPVAEDMLEGARLCGADFIVNTVLNRQQKIAGVFAGELDAAHRAATAFARQLYATPIARKADFVLATAGSAKNFIQSHKALYNAAQCIGPHGKIVFACPAPEGFGGHKFGQWLALGSPEAIIAELRKNAEINGQTALSTIEKAPRSIFITGLGEPEMAMLGARRAAGLPEALAMLREDFARQGVDKPSYYVLPSASWTVPMLAP